MGRSIFALEVAVRTGLGHPLRKYLHDLVNAQGATVGWQTKAQAYQAAATALLQNLTWIDRGCWDFFDDDGRAARDFAMWTNGMVTREGARPAPSMDPHHGTHEVRYLTFTMALLLVQGSPAERALQQRCSIPQDRLWRRETIGWLLQGVPMVDFRSVVADVMYLIPGHDTFALTLDDLAQPKFEYLRQLQ